MYFYLFIHVLSHHREVKDRQKAAKKTGAAHGPGAQANIPKIQKASRSNARGGTQR
jgi:hypothetical protein